MRLAVLGGYVVNAWAIAIIATVSGHLARGGWIWLLPAGHGGRSGSCRMNAPHRGRRRVMMPARFWMTATGWARLRRPLSVLAVTVLVLAAVGVPELAKAWSVGAGAP